MHSTGNNTGQIWIRSFGSHINCLNKNRQTAINSEYVTSIKSDCECIYDAFSQDCSDNAQSRYLFVVSMMTNDGEKAIVWTKDVFIKNGVLPEARKEFLARIESFKVEILDEVFRLLGEKRGPARLDFYTELDKIKF